MRFREFLRAAVSATLTQDSRQELLLVRMSACNAELDMQVGTIGMVRTHGGATSLAVATLTVLENFCTPYSHQPAGAAGSKAPSLDTGLMKHICSIVTWWYTDAASDELSAGEILVTSAAAKRLFPNLKIIGREKAHASRRVLERPQKAEAFLDDVANQFRWGHQSIASVLQHMPTCHSVFKAVSQANDGASAITSLRFKRHRFDSQAEPLARMSMQFGAVVQAASKISHARKSENAGKQATAFLQWLDDEKALQMAMLADAADQVLTLVRQHDTDFPDPAQYASFVSAFILEGTRMWLEDKCWAIGCTDIMMRFLAKSRTYLIAGGSGGALTLGGHVDDAVKSRCIGRMKTWFRLAIAVCHAEFPYFEASSSFQVFEVTDNPGRDAAEIAGDAVLAPLERLANIFGCERDVVYSQFQRHLALARSEKQSSSQTNLSA